jgi:hypothetical protein
MASTPRPQSLAQAACKPSDDDAPKRRRRDRDLLVPSKTLRGTGTAEHQATRPRQKLEHMLKKHWKQSHRPEPAPTPASKLLEAVKKLNGGLDGTLEKLKQAVSKAPAFDPGQVLADADAAVDAAYKVCTVQGWSCESQEAYYQAALKAATAHRALAPNDERTCSLQRLVVDLATDLGIADRPQPDRPAVERNALYAAAASTYAQPDPAHPEHQARAAKLACRVAEDDVNSFYLPSQAPDATEADQRNYLNALMRGMHAFESTGDGSSAVRYAHGVVDQATDMGWQGTPGLPSTDLVRRAAATVQANPQSELQRDRATALLGA